jgi:hypothetical protein
VVILVIPTILFLVNLVLLGVGLAVGIRCYKRGTMRKLPGFLIVLGASAVVLQMVWLLVRFKWGQTLTFDDLFAWPVAKSWAMQRAYHVASFTVLALVSWSAAFVVWAYDRYLGFAPRRRLSIVK